MVCAVNAHKEVCKLNGDILKKLRLEAKLTQDQLAKELGISSSTIRMIEIGKRNGSNVVINKIADYFKVTLDFLDGRSEERNLDEQEKGEMIDKFLDTLIEEGVITDPNAIDDETAEMILNAVKAKIGYKILKRKGK